MNTMASPVGYQYWQGPREGTAQVEQVGGGTGFGNIPVLPSPLDQSSPNTLIRLQPTLRWHRAGVSKLLRIQLYDIIITYYVIFHFLNTSFPLAIGYQYARKLIVRLDIIKVRLLQNQITFFLLNRGTSPYIVHYPIKSTYNTITFRYGQNCHFNITTCFIL